MSKTSLSIHGILCPTDFSELAASAFAESVRLARWFGAQVTVVHVVPVTASIVGDMGYLPVVSGIDDVVRGATLRTLQEFVDATEHAGVPVALACREGNACEEIRRLAQETGAGLVVMGTHGRSGFRRLVLGSVTEAVLDHPPVPVLAVNRKLPQRKGLYATVLCATDVSKGSARTVAVALAIAGDGSKRVTVLNVVEHGVEAFRGSIEQAAVTALHGIIPEEARGVRRIDERVELGEADREILDVAAEEASDLIVMGTRGHGAFGPFFGSTVRSVVRNATCPVMVVPAGFTWPATELRTKTVRTKAGHPPAAGHTGAR